MSHQTGLKTTNAMCWRVLKTSGVCLACVLGLSCAVAIAVEAKPTEKNGNNVPRSLKATLSDAKVSSSSRTTSRTLTAGAFNTSATHDASHPSPVDVFTSSTVPPSVRSLLKQ